MVECIAQKSPGGSLKVLLVYVILMWLLYEKLTLNHFKCLFSDVDSSV